MRTILEARIHLLSLYSNHKLDGSQWLYWNNRLKDIEVVFKYNLEQQSRRMKIKI